MLGESSSCSMSSSCRSPELAKAMDTTGSVGCPRYTEPVWVRWGRTSHGPTPGVSHPSMARVEVAYDVAVLTDGAGQDGSAAVQLP